MAEQGTEEQTSSDQQSSEEASGRHRATDEGAADQSESADGATGKDAPEEAKTEKSAAPEEAEAEKSAPAESKTEKSAAPEEAKTEKSAPAESKTEKSAPAEAKTEKSAAPEEAKTEQHRRGAADTSWAEPETPQRRHVDVGEIAWRAGNVIATLVRTLAILFALVLIANLVLVLVGVNPANGVAQFIGGLAGRVILGFRDLFVPADPTIALIVNSLVAAAFWVFVGELLSRLIRFLAARVK
ncbi:hypothetical protein [Actinomycetospora sp. NBRC 106378]|uniref:hypothetical protein n=1 Tax=Actinomycetospora sp. NBRC 106378 TaxID=3032208 RepID=UPI0024A1AF98|nr:hypothetical protein [Actinomycetospora sp. NBRC 106378]GLZ52751.1 hypothetical protein Acsp07_23680 [Actinomycetospora sp. NBRC 106378]